jgi:dTDP-4-amino-4,6-dideoxygalactose transaminase
VEIPYGHQSINQADVDAVIKVLNSDNLTNGPSVTKFETDLQNFTGGAPAIAVSSGTAALHCAYFAAGIGAGDEVITPPLTFIATQAAAAQLGARIVFSDIDYDTGNIDPNQLVDKINHKTKAIVAVDYAGHPAELDDIRKICDEYNLIFIEDASHALGSKYKNQYVGAIADITTFSFFPTKNITTGEGGAVVSKNSKMLQRAKRFSRQGLIREKDNFRILTEGDWHQEVHEFGLNYRLPDILAALGSSQLERLNTFRLTRNKIFETYCSELSYFEEFELPIKRDYVDPFWHLFPLRVPKNLRQNLYDYLNSMGVKVQINYLPAHLHPVFGLVESKHLQNSKNYYDKEISLPIYHDLKEKQIDYILEKIGKFMKSKKL